MSNDFHWRNAKSFLHTYLQAEEKLVAPKLFKKEFLNAYSYEATATLEVSQICWVLLHKGLLQKLDSVFLNHTVAALKPVFANEVFVLFTRRQDIASDVDSMHLEALWAYVNPAESGDSPVKPHPAQRLLGKVNQVRKLSFSKSQGGKSQDSNQIHSALNAVLNRLTHLEKVIQRQGNQRQGQSDRKALIHKSKAIATMPVAEFTDTCRAACQTAYLGDDTLLCRVLAKYLLYADSKDIGIVPHLSLNGFWEPWLTLAMARILQPGWCCIDVGANHGYYTLLMAGIVGTSGRVVALEPNPKLVALLRQTIEVNGHQTFTTVRSDAVSDSVGQKIKLFIPQGRGMNASITHAVTANDEVLEVETTTIDQITADWSAVDFIKIDAEGAEEGIWRGMQQTLRKHCHVAIVLEFNCDRYADPAAFLLAIEAEGFALRHIDFDAEIKPLTLEQCLSERLHQDWLLYLQKQES